VGGEVGILVGVSGGDGVVGGGVGTESLRLLDFFEVGSYG